MTLTATVQHVARLSFAASIVLLNFCAQTQSAQAYSFQNLSDRNGDGVFNDADYDLFAKGANRQFTTKGVIESRIGNNNAEAGVWELGTYTSTYNPDSTYTNALNAGQQGHTWTKGVAQNFEMTYNGSSLVYKIAGKTVTQSISGVTDLLLRTRAGGAASSLNLTNMALFDNLGNSKATWAAQGSSTTSATADIDYLRIADLKPGFTLKGSATMDWIGTARPSNSNLAFQWKVGTMPEPRKHIPEPGTIGAMAIVGAMAVRKRMAK